MIIDPIETKERLDKMAKKFEEALQPHNKSNGAGWGQFLDVSKKLGQTGPYGTSAGLIVLAMAERGDSVTVKNALKLLHYWWKERNNNDNTKYKDKFAQIIRVAFLYLSLRLSQASTDDNFISEVRRILYDSILPSNYWSNYWYSKQHYDNTPKRFVSGLALISFYLLNQNANHIENTSLEGVRSNLQNNKFASPMDLSIADEAVMLAGILSAKDMTLTKRSLKKIQEISHRPYLSLAERGSYFFECPSSENNGEKCYNDYFFIPTAIIQAIAGYQDNAPDSLRIYSDHVIKELIKNLDNNKGLYCPHGEDRISTVDQAWIAILLRIVADNCNKTKMLNNIKYRLTRERPDNFFINILKIFTLILTIVCASYFKDIISIVENFILIAIVLIVGQLYSDSLKELFQKIYRWRK